LYTKLQEEKGTAILVKFTEVLKPMTNLYLTATTTDSVSMLATFIPLILMIVIFYFLLIRPQKKRDKEVQKMRENIEIADEIVTIGGIIGRVVSIKDDTVVIETASDHSKIRMARWSIQQNITATERAAQEQQAKKEEK
jgi:preprotein translocase subunit YajC